MVIKKRKNRITIYFSIGTLLIMLISQFYFFPLTKSNIDSDAMKFISVNNHAKVLNFENLDVLKTSNNINAIYHVTLSTGEEKYYAISYMKSLVFPRYSRVSYLEYTGNNFMVLKSPGFIKDFYYTVSGNALIYQRSQFNRGLNSLVLLAFFIMYAVIRVILDEVTYRKYSNSK